MNYTTICSLEKRGSEMGKVCCFIGHRKINLTKELEDNLIKTIEDLIINKGVNRFLFLRVIRGVKNR